MQSRQSVKYTFFFFTLYYFMRRWCRRSKQGSWLEPSGVGRFITKLKKKKMKTLQLSGQVEGIICT